MLDEKRWVQLNKFPKSVELICGMCETNKVFYVVGSTGISTSINNLTLTYKFASNKEYNWCATCRVGNNILVFCKNDVDDDDDDDVKSLIFNPIDKQWSDANIKLKRELFEVVYYLNNIWIIGGCEYDYDGRWNIINTVEVYDSISKEQVFARIKMNEARRGHKVIVYKDKLFVFGGLSQNHDLLNTVEMFSPATKKFVMMAPMKTARRNFACCRVGNFVYVISGSTHGVKTNSVEIYNLDSNTWTDGVDLPVSGQPLYACAVNNKLK